MKLNFAITTGTSPSKQKSSIREKLNNNFDLRGITSIQHNISSLREELLHPLHRPGLEFSRKDKPGLEPSSPHRSEINGLPNVIFLVFSDLRNFCLLNC